MRLTKPAFLLLLSAVAAAQAPVVPVVPEISPPAAIATIVEDELLAHARFLAADDLGGRLTGSPGQIAAARYIAAHFEQLGLEPLGDEVDGKRGWLQHYGVARTHVLETTRLELGALVLTEGFAILGGRAVDVRCDGTLRFCGLGRTRGAAADVSEDERLDGKVAVVAIRGPRGRIDRDLTVEQKFGMSFQTFGMLGRTAKALARKGAAAVLFVQGEDRGGLSDVLNYLALAPGKDMLAANFQGAGEGMGAIAQLSGGDAEAPSLVLSVPASMRLLGELGLDPAALAAALGGDGEMPVAKADVPAKLVIAVAHDPAGTASNVVAVLRGSDPQLAAEAIVYSAHMDHVGRRIDGEVFNGADDNASGTSGLLAIAGAYSKSAERPRRSIIFLAVSGEELGLWGSAWFAENPTWEAANLVANVNTDMIGRSGPESGPTEVAVTPSFRHAMFSTIVQDAARFGAQLGISFTSGDKYYARSDHYNFAQKGIPVVFFCNGEHEDYHQVTDHAEKLDGAKMERIARLAFWTGWAVANADERPRQLGRREAWY